MATKSKTNTSSNNLKAIVPLVKRAIAFLAVFVIYSGLIGPRIISGDIIYKDHFGIYGGLGKSVLFGAIALMTMVWQRGYNLQLERWRPINLIWLILSVLSFIVAWFSVDVLLSGSTSLIYIIEAQSLLIASVAFACVGVFGARNLRKLTKTYKREISYTLILILLFYFFLIIVYGLWKALANVVLHSVKWLLNRTGIAASIFQPRTLVLKKFAIEVAEYCSGIESIALFTSLYTLIAVLDWGRLNHKRVLMIFPAALIILFGLNILRVYVLILGGYYINPHIAFSLFHTYAGMILFIMYSIIFWVISYKWMLQDR